MGGLASEGPFLECGDCGSGTTFYPPTAASAPDAPAVLPLSSLVAGPRPPPSANWCACSRNPLPFSCRIVYCRSIRSVGIRSHPDSRSPRSAVNAIYRTTKWYSNNTNGTTAGSQGGSAGCSATVTPCGDSCHSLGTATTTVTAMTAVCCQLIVVWY